MSSKQKNILQSLVGVLIGAFFMFITLRDKPLSDIVSSIRSANIGWCLLSALFLLLIFFLRSQRWAILLGNMGFHPKWYKVFYATLMGYYVNSFTPKLGELVRCTSLAKTSNVPISNNFGTIVSERIYDVLVLLVGLFVIVLIEYQRLQTMLLQLGASVLHLLSANSWLLVVVPLFMVAGIYVVYRINRSQRADGGLFGFVRRTVQSTLNGFRLRRYNSFIVYTIFIWLALVAMNYCFLKALPETSDFNFYFAAVVLFVGGLGWAMPSPGGMGTTHFFILQLFILFSLEQNAGLAFGVLSNGLTFVFTIVYGTIALLLKWGYSAKKLRATVVAS